jgi:hypothetical protein
MAPPDSADIHRLDQERGESTVDESKEILHW